MLTMIAGWRGECIGVASPPQDGTRLATVANRDLNLKRILSAAGEETSRRLSNLPG